MVQIENCGLVCEDRISALPEDLLVMILDLVPAKDALATMLLSKRWRSIWTMTQRLEYIDSEEEEEEEDSDDNYDSDDNDDSDDDSDSDDDDDDDEQEHKDDDNENENEDKVKYESKKSVWWFLDKSLQLHKAPVIDSMCVELGRRCPTDAHVGKWVANAVDRSVLVMKLKLLWFADPTTMPESLYSCKCLMTLTLSHKILVDVPTCASLPSLQTLELYYVVYQDDDSLVRLLSSCPVLERLFVKRNKKDDNVTKFSVVSHSLWYFRYDNERICPKNNDDAGGRCLVVDTPALTFFRASDSSGDSYSIEMPCLETAIIDTVSYPDEKFLTSLSSVLNLWLFLTDETAVWCRNIKFSRLTECRISPEESDWTEPTISLLVNAPTLKHLIVDYLCTSDQPEDLPLLWNQPSSVPGCLSSQLETFEWAEYGGREEEEQFLTYVLANSKCLKTASISMRSSFNLEEQQMMTQGVKDIPMVSTEAQLIIFKT